MVGCNSFVRVDGEALVEEGEGDTDSVAVRVVEVVDVSTVVCNIVEVDIVRSSKDVTRIVVVADPFVDAEVEEVIELADCVVIGPPSTYVLVTEVCKTTGVVVDAFVVVVEVVICPGTSVVVVTLPPPIPCQSAVLNTLVQAFTSPSFPQNPPKASKASCANGSAVLAKLAHPAAA